MSKLRNNSLLYIIGFLFMLNSFSVYSQRKYTKEELKAIKEFRKYNSGNLKSYSLKGLTGGIPSLNSSYCNNEGSVLIEKPDNLPNNPAVTDIEWRVQTNLSADGGIIDHPEWIEIEGTGINKKMRLHLERIESKYYETYINVICTGYNNFGFPVGGWGASDLTQVFEAPTVYDVSADNSSMCPGANTTVTVSNTQTGYMYLLYKDGAPMGGAPLSGSDGSPGNFTVTEEGTYSIYAQRSTAPLCLLKMNGDVTISINPVPVITISPAVAICVGQTATISASSDMDADGAIYSWSDGTNTYNDVKTLDVNPVVTTTYNLTVTNPNTGCSSNASVVVTVNELPTVTLSQNQVCDGGNLNLMSQVVGGSGTYNNYSWEHPSSGSVYNVQNPIINSVVRGTDDGIYNFIVTDDLGCSSSETSINVVIDENPVPIINGDVNVTSTTLCEGGSLTIVGEGGTSYKWTFPDGSTANDATLTITSVVKATHEGIYTLEVDNGKCKKTLEHNVIINPLPIVTATNDGPVCQGASVNISSTPDAMATYEWTGPNGYTSSNQNNLLTNPQTGTYSVTVTDANGCSVTAFTDVVVNENPTTAPTNDAVCDNTDLHLYSNPSGGANPYSYQWTNNGNPVSTDANPVFAPADRVTHNQVYSVVVTDQNGCSSTSSDITVVIPESPEVTLPANTEVCQGSDVTITATASKGDGNYSYVWKHAGVVITGETSASLNIAAADLVNNDVYSVYVTDGNNCSSSLEATTTIILNPLPVVTATNDGPVCQGASVNISSTPDAMATYAWTGPNGYTSSNQNNLLTNPQTGTYSVTVTDAKGCQASATTDVVVNENPVTAPTNDAVCDNTDLHLYSNPSGGTNPYSYQWTNNGNPVSTDANPVFTPADRVTHNQVYSVVVTDQNGCSSTSSDITVVIPESPEVTLPANTEVCQGSDVTITATASKGDGNYSYVWKHAGAVITGETSASLNIAASDLVNNDVYSVSVTDGNNCSSSLEATTTIILNPLPVVTATNDGPVCQGASVNISSTPDAMATYEWTGPNGYASSSQNNLLTNPQTGTYFVTVTDAKGCQASATTDVVVNENPATAPTNDAVCDNTDLHLYSNPSGGTNPYSYQWTNNGNPVSTDANPVFTPADRVTHNQVYSVVVTDQNGCSSTSSDITVVIPESPEVTLPSNTNVCQGSDVTITATASKGDGNYSYVWKHGTEIIVGATSQSLHISAADLVNNDVYSVSVTDGNNCSSSLEAKTTIIINALPIVTASNDGPVCDGGTLNITSTPDGMATYAWTGPNGYTSSSQNNSLTNTKPGTYSVTVTDANGCQVSATTEVVVNELPTVVLSGTQEVCLNTDIELTATVTSSLTGDFAYEFSGPDAFSVNKTVSDKVLNINRENAQLSYTGDYSVVVTDANGCKSNPSNNLAVKVNDKVKVILDASYSVCVGNDITISATLQGDATNYDKYTWYKGTTELTETSANLTLTGVQISDAGEYSVKVGSTSGNVCESDVVKTNLTVKELPVVSVVNNNQIVCEGQDVTLEVTVTPDTPGSSYYWTGPNGFASTVNNNSIILSGVIPNMSGDYFVVVTQPGADGCTSEKSEAIKVTINPKSVITIPPTYTFLNGATTGSQLVCSGGDVSAVYQWTKDGVVIPAATSATLDLPSPISKADEGTYGVKVILNGDICESDEVTTVVTVEDPTMLPISVSSTDVSCAGEDFTLTATVIGTGNFTYKWYFDDGVTGDVLIPGATENTYTVTNSDVSNSGKYSVEAYKSGVKITDLASVSVTINELPIVNLPANISACLNGSKDIVAIPAGGSGNYVKYIWKKNSVLLSETSDTYSIANVTTTDADTYSVEVIDDNGCNSLPIETNLSVVSVTPLLSASPSGSVELGTNVEFTAAGGDEYEFFVNDVLVQARDSKNTYSSSLLKNNDKVSVTVYDNASGCYASAEIIMNVTNPELKALDVTFDPVSKSYCEGEAGVNAEIKNPQLGVSYRLIDVDNNSIVSTLNYNGVDNISWTNIQGTANYKIIGFYPADESVIINMNNQPFTITKVALPKPYNISCDNTSICSGNKTEIYISESEISIEYALKDDADNYSAWKTGNGARLGFEVTNAGSYSIVARNISAGQTCETTMPNSPIAITQAANPSAFDISITHEGTGCGDGDVITVSNSATGITYALFKIDGTNYIPVTSIPNINGSDGNDVSFEPIVDKNATYTVAAVNTTGCLVYANSTIVVDVPESLVVQTFTGGGDVCSSDLPAVFGLENSELGVKYSLFREGEALPIEEIDGTGAAINFTGVNTEGVYFAMATKGSCSMPMSNKSTLKILAPIVVNIDVSNPLCVGKDLIIDANATGGSGVYTEYLWTGPNGFGSNNKKLVFVDAVALYTGTYSVTVTDDSGCKATVSSDIVINEKPNVTISSVDDYNNLCEGQNATFEATGGVVYTWFVDDVIVQGPNSNNTYSSNTFTNGQKIYAEVANSGGCTANTETLTLSVNSLPESYNVITDNTVDKTDGNYCSDGEGVSIMVEKQQENVVYNLYRNSVFVSSKTGVAGSDPLVFDGKFTDEGTYSVKATLAGTNCSVDMNNTINVVVKAIPVAQQAFNDNSYFCTGGSTSIYMNTTESGMEYAIVNSQGDYSDWKAGTGASITFDINVAETYLVVGRNSEYAACESTMLGGPFVINESNIPGDFNISIVTEGTGCGDGDVVGVSNSENGLEYQLVKVVGATYVPVNKIPVVIGNGSDIVFEPVVDVNSQYTVKVSNSAGCYAYSSQQVTINVDGSINSYELSGDKNICAGETSVFTLSNSDNTVSYSLYRDGVVDAIETITGTGAPISFAPIAEAGEYYVMGKSDVCTQEMSNRIILNVYNLPNVVINTNSPICEGEDLSISSTVDASTVIASYLWTGPNSFTTTDKNIIFANATPAFNGVYSLSVVDNNGCKNNFDSTPVVVTSINPEIKSSDDDNIICQGELVTFTASGGNNYEWFINDVIVANENNETFNSQSLNNGDKVKAKVYSENGNCEAFTDEMVMTVNPSPTAAISVAPSANVYPNTELTFTAIGGDEYEFIIDGNIVQNRSANNVYINNTLTSSATVIVKVYNASGCKSEASVDIKVKEDIQSRDVTLSDTDYCADQNGVDVIIDNPQVGVTYSLTKMSDNTVNTIECTSPGTIMWQNVKQDNYQVHGYYADKPDDKVLMNNGDFSISENILPTVYDLTSPAGASVVGCGGSEGQTISLNGSETGVVYNVLVNNIPSAISLEGTGGQLTFEKLTIIGVYTIQASNKVTGCSVLMNGNFTIEKEEDVTLFNIYAVHPDGSTRTPDDGRYCSSEDGIAIALDGSETDATYKVYRDGNFVKDVAGTGNILQLGTFKETGIYTVRVSTAKGCEHPMNGNVNVSSVNPPNILSIATDNAIDETSGDYCIGDAGVNIFVKGQQKDVVYTLYKDGVEVSTKTSTINSSANLSFDAPVTEEGLYVVKAKFTDIGCEITMANAINVKPVALPVVQTLKVDKDVLCSGDVANIYIDKSEIDVEYTLFDSNDNMIESKTGNNSILKFEVSNEETYYIGAKRILGSTSCSVKMDGSITIVKGDVPADFTIELKEPGTGCDNGAIITVKNSIQDYSYQLVKVVGNNYFPVINISDIVGNGGDIDFDRILDSNAYYTVRVFNNISGCEAYSSTEISVNVPNAIARQALLGNDNICRGDAGSVLSLSDTENGVTYSLYRVGETDALVTVEGNNKPIDFPGTYSKAGEYYVIASRAGTCNVEMDNRLNITFSDLPTAFVMSGSGLTCDITKGAVIGLENSESNTKYDFYYTPEGGTLTYSLTIDGKDGNPIKTLVNKPGKYSIIAINSNGCTSNMNGEVIVKETSMPNVVSITNSDFKYCANEAGITLELENNEKDVTYQLLDETNNVITEVIGTNEDFNVKQSLVFDKFIPQGKYTLWATRGGDACKVPLNGGFPIVVEEPYPIPSTGTFNQDKTETCVGTQVEVTLIVTDTDVVYELYDDNLPDVKYKPTRNGDKLTWIINEPVAGEYFYSIEAISGGKCNKVIVPLFRIEFLDIPSGFTIFAQNEGVPTDTYCSANGGLSIGVANSKENVVYKLFETSAPATVINTIVGDGSAEMIFSGLYPKGEYSVEAQLIGGCKAESDNKLTIKELLAPNKYDFTSDIIGNTLCSRDSITLTLNNSQSGIVYHLRDGNSHTDIAGVETKEGTDGESIVWKVTSETAGVFNYEVYGEVPPSDECGDIVANLDVTYKPSPETFITYSDPVEPAYCEGKDGVKLGVKNIVEGAYYKVYDVVNNQELGSAIYGNTGDFKLFESYFTKGKYVVVAEKADCKLQSTDTISVTSMPLPANDPDSYVISCGSNNDNCVIGSPICINMTENNIEYYLHVDGNPTGDKIVGNASEGCFPNATKSGEYTVLAVNPVTKCDSWLSGKVTMKNVPLMANDDTLRVNDDKLDASVNVSLNDILSSIDIITNPENNIQPENSNIRFKLLKDNGEIAKNNKYSHTVGINDKLVGVYSINPNTGVLKFQKAPNFYGLDSVRYIIENIDYLSTRIDTATVTVFVGNEEIIEGKSFILPNLFTPNGDGFNDYFVITGLSVDDVKAEKSTLEVFNRWGDLVYRSKGSTYGANGDWWDGTSSSNFITIGRKLPVGTYFYIYKIKANVDGKIVDKEYHGFVELRR